MMREKEFEYLLSFIKEAYFDTQIARWQLRSLWTAFCLHNNIDCDTARYDNHLIVVWEAMLENETNPWSTSKVPGVPDYVAFDLYMGEELC